MAVEGKIAQIISPLEVAFSVGEADGVAVDDIAIINRLIEVSDPDTRETLGTVKRPVIRFKIVEIGERFSVGRSIDIVRSNASASPALKRVTDDPSMEDWRTIFVRPGLPVDIETPDEDIPF